MVLSDVDDLETFIRNFYGTVVSHHPDTLPSLHLRTVYLCGDVSRTAAIEEQLGTAERVFVVREFSSGKSRYPVVGQGRVPMHVHGVGVYYREFFENSFDAISTEHDFQSLTESNKPGVALRTGIYLTPVTEEVGEDGSDTHFRLLRCSSNLSGPTDNFRETDTRIVDALNLEAAGIFHNPAPLNHVLAQIYENTSAEPGRKQTKAKISAHADKTKDMPRSAIMAFCTFYDNLDRIKPFDTFDHGHKGITGLTRLHFRLKKCVAERAGCDLEHEFSVTLFPNSAFFIPLSTNRLYTHEIRPSALGADRIPTRLGYVVRCSNSEAVHGSDGQTYLKLCGKRVVLNAVTGKDMTELRARYSEENRTDAFVEYGSVLFSMNKGDYEKPLV